MKIHSNHYIFLKNVNIKVFINILPFLILIYSQSFGIEDSGTLMLVLDNREIQQNRKESWFPKLQNVLVVT